MKVKRIIALILMIFLIISISCKSLAKYIFEYTIKAAEITIINN